MTKKQYWHKAWQRNSAGLLHSSGLQAFKDAQGAWVADPACAPAWQATMQAQGVSVDDRPARFARLIKEAAMWRDPDQRRRELLAKRLPPKFAPGTKPQTQKSPAPGG